MRKGLTVASVQGPRFYQEDRYCIVPISSGSHLGWLLAVMDGHCGSADVAQYCKEAIPRLVEQEITVCGSVEEGLRNLVSRLDEATRKKNCGSTLSIACVLENERRAVISIIGDSPVVAITSDGSILKSPEHNVGTNLNERAAAERRGGYYGEGYIHNASDHGLQLSRSLGDADFGSIVSHEPDIYCVSNLGKGGAIIVATDGLFDPTHSANSGSLFDEVAAIVKKGKGAQALINWARSRIRDNTTVIVWHSIEA